MSRAQTYGLALSIFLTVASPFSVSAGPRCEAIFNALSASSPEAPYFSSRFGHVQKPHMTPKFAAPARLVLTKFAGHKDFHSASTFTWVHNGETYTQDHASSTHQVGFGADESIYADQQDFSLGKMVETTYLIPGEADEFRKDGLKRETGQISFLEVVHDATPEEVRAIYGEYPSQKIGGTHTHGRSNDLSLVPIKTAALYTVGGQVWSKTGTPRALALPWENEPSRAAQRLDRKKYPYVWEWGRAAQDAPGEIAPLYGVAALMNYVELCAHGGDLDHAFVMVHSFDKVNTRLYSRMHPNSIYPAGWKDASDTLFLVPLREALEKYPASGASEHISNILKLSGGRLKNIDAIDLLIDNKLLRWNEMDYQFDGVAQSSPIIINDMSNSRSGLILARLKTMGLDRLTSEHITDYLLGIPPLLHTANTDGKYDHAADSLMTSHTYLHENAIEISNLDPQLAKKNPYYVPSVLMSAFAVQVAQIAHTISHVHQLSHHEGYQEAAEWLRQNPTQFGVTTSDPEIQRQLKMMSPVKILTQLGTATEDGAPVDAHLLKSNPYWYRDSQMFFFTAEQVRLMISRNPEFFHRYGSNLHAGVWRSQYLMSQTDLF